MSSVAPPIETPGVPLRTRLVTPYVLVLAAAALAIAFSADSSALGDQPWLALALVATLVALGHVETDLFGSGHVSPTTAPAIMIALLFGPAASVAAEASVALARLARGRDALKALFDLAALGLSGAAAWAVAQGLPHDGAGVLLTGLVAGVAYLAVNHLLLVIVWVLHEGLGPRALWLARLLPGLPQEVAFGPIAGLLALAVAELGIVALGLIVLPTVGLWAGQRQTLEISNGRIAEVTEANDNLRRLMLTTVESLARTIEARDPYTGGHTERVERLAHDIAVALGFDAEELRALAVGAVIHDIGKIGVPDAILLKPGPLDDHEWAEMRRHPEIGSYILDELEIPQLAKDMARSHHERYDGTGYPDGVAGEEIPLAARVLTVADALDAMTSDRPYRRALPMEVALAEVEAKAGTQFCPRVVDAALRVTSA